MITEKDIRNIAKLSSLYITDEDIPKLTKDMQEMSDFAQVVCGFDADVRIVSDNQNASVLLREDEVKASCPLDEVLSNADESKDGYFLLRKSE